MSTATLNPTESLVGLCRNCKALLETPQYEHAKFEFGDQIWICNDCGLARKWGEKRPWDTELRPALICELCDCVTRHQFLRVA